MPTRQLVLASVSLHCALLVAGAGCGSDHRAPGIIEVRTYGEALIEAGIPADVFKDGWSVRFDRFLVSLSQVAVAGGRAAEPVAKTTSPRVFDLVHFTGGMGQVVLAGMAAGGAYDHVTYRIAPATAGATASADLPVEVLDLMITSGESVRVEGTAEKAGSPTIAFAWGFTSSVRHECHTAIVVDGATATTEITIHGDHLFYDDLVSPAPMVAFELIANSDGDGDGTVTQRELAARDISAQERYQVGNTGISDLWSFIAHQVTSVGHIDGEGHCETSVQ